MQTTKLNTFPLPSNALSCCVSPTSFWSPFHVVESVWLEHGPFAFWLIEALRPRTLVELGTHHGFSFLAFCQAVQRLCLATVCYAVDTWQGDEHAGFYGEEVYAQLATLNDRRYSAFARLLRCRFDEARPYFAEGSVDMLHIDGRHTYEDVKQDFESWRDTLSNCGVVLFHDTNVRERDFGVWRLWAELSRRYPSFEFMHGHGLGVLALGRELPEKLRALFGAAPEQASAIRAAYAQLGQSISLRYQLDIKHRELCEAVAEQHRLRAAHASNLAAQEARLNDALVEQKRTRIVQIEQAEALHATESALAQSCTKAAALERQNTELRELARDQYLTRQTLVQVQQSTFWRATTLLRRELARLPRPLYRTLRRGAKAVYWAITPHRLPARIAFLRARKQLRHPLISSTVAPQPACCTDMRVPVGKGP